MSRRAVGGSAGSGAGRGSGGSGGARRPTALHRTARGRSRALPRLASRRLSAGSGWSGRGAQGAQKSARSRAAPAPAERRRRAGAPRASALGDDRPRQPQLPQPGRQQPTPAIGASAGSGGGSWSSPVLLEEAEQMLHGEAALIPAPDRAQIGRQRPALPDQPQRRRAACCGVAAGPPLTRTHRQLDRSAPAGCAAAPRPRCVTSP